jgi:predicted house-cleaning noncanonical NTP pyrophosphatase (MazG superfamily)
MKYNKLVRDKVPAYIKSKGEISVTHIATDSEYWQKLKEKLLEEFEEFQKNERIEEYTDMLEVIEAIGNYKKFNNKDVQQIKMKKAEEKGKFNDRIILEES